MSLVLSDGSSLYSASVDHNNLGNGHFEFEANTLNFPSPFGSCPFEPRILGSCNGLLCLGFPECCVLWNPSTRTHHVLPSHPDDEEGTNKGGYSVVHGLGYDEMNDDFKFVRVHQFRGRSDSEVWVYSLNSKSWKNHGDFPYHVQFGKGVTDVFVNGSLHYIVNEKNKSFVEGEGGSEDSEYLIAAFDVSAETYQLIPKASSVNLDDKFEIGVLDGCLCMVLNDNDVGNFRLLEMKEYGNELSWIESFRIESSDDGPFSMRPITYVMRNQDEKHVVLEGEDQVFCFDVENDSLNDLHVNVIDEDNYCGFVVEVCVCMESQRVLDTADC